MYYHLVGCIPKSQRPLLKQHVHELIHASTVNYEFLLLLTRRHVKVVFIIILCKRLRILCVHKQLFVILLQRTIHSWVLCISPRGSPFHLNLIIHSLHISLTGGWFLSAQVECHERKKGPTICMWGGKREKSANDAIDGTACNQYRKVRWSSCC